MEEKSMQQTEPSVITTTTLGQPTEERKCLFVLIWNQGNSYECVQIDKTVPSGTVRQLHAKLTQLSMLPENTRLMDELLIIPQPRAVDEDVLRSLIAHPIRMYSVTERIATDTALRSALTQFDTMTNKFGRLAVQKPEEPVCHELMCFVQGIVQVTTPPKLEDLQETLLTRFFATGTVPPPVSALPTVAPTAPTTMESKSDAQINDLFPPFAQTKGNKRKATTQLRKSENMIQSMTGSQRVRDEHHDTNQQKQGSGDHKTRDRKLTTRVVNEEEDAEEEEEPHEEEEEEAGSNDRDDDDDDDDDTRSHASISSLSSGEEHGEEQDDDERKHDTNVIQPIRVEGQPFEEDGDSSTNAEEEEEEEEEDHESKSKVPVNEGTGNKSAADGENRASRRLRKRTRRHLEQYNDLVMRIKALRMHRSLMQSRRLRKILQPLCAVVTQAVHASQPLTVSETLQYLNLFRQELGGVSL